MRKIIIINIIILVLMSIPIYALEVPDEPDVVILNKIDSEHKATRQYLQNELGKREKEFLDEFTKRADFYENTFEDIIRKTVILLSMAWAGVVFISMSIQRLLSNKAEKKRYAVLKEALKHDIINEFKSINYVLPQHDLAVIEKLKKSQKQEEENKKFSWFKKKDKNKFNFKELINNKKVI
jgi:UDP-N-acetylglucosamine transferase subunit ALG13